jgi:hypothetical protein
MHPAPSTPVLRTKVSPTQRPSSFLPGRFNADMQIANLRMRDAGVQVVSHFVIMGELMRDWRGTPGAKQLMPYLDAYIPEFSFLARSHGYAVLNGTLMEGQETLL